MKQIRILAIFLTLLLNFTPAAKAQNNTFFMEYNQENGQSQPQTGIDWQISRRWNLALKHQLVEFNTRQSNTYLEARYQFPNQFTTALHYETCPANRSAGIKLDWLRPLHDALWFNGSITYADYNFQTADPDYALVKTNLGLQYRLSPTLMALASLENAGYRYNPRELTPGSNPNYHELQVATGMAYQLNPAFYFTGVYYFTDTRCEDPATALLWGRSRDKFVVTANYALGRYHLYFEYPFAQTPNPVKAGFYITF